MEANKNTVRWTLHQSMWQKQRPSCCDFTMWADRINGLFNGRPPLVCEVLNSLQQIYIVKTNFSKKANHVWNRKEEISHHTSVKIDSMTLRSPITVVMWLIVATIRLAYSRDIPTIGYHNRCFATNCKLGT